MYVCICKQVDENKLQEAFQAGYRDLHSLGAELGLGTKCGSCRNFARELIKELDAPGDDAAQP